MSKEKVKKEKKVKEPKAKKVKKAKKGTEPVLESPADGVVPQEGGKPVKPKIKYPVDIYTLILLVAWLALTAACVLAYLDLNSYK